jgi:V/A-type H+-transporting ATPase subunit D
MARAPINKSALAGASVRLARYREYLPALDLKRRQLLAELASHRAQLEGLRSERARCDDDLPRRIPMLADETIEVDGLVVVAAVRTAERNVLGTRVPVVEAIDLRRADYSLLVKPHWVDVLARALERTLVLEVEIRTAAECVRRFAEASRIVTQRVKLFEKVLIPRAEAELRRLRILLADADRYAAVRGKIAKAKAQRRAAQEFAR